MSESKAEAFRDLEAMYAELDREVEALGAVCRSSGRCCRFREHGHQLWVTRLELDHLRERGGPIAETPTDACPYLKGNLCGAREGRTLGCRAYFCDPGVLGRMEPLYEKYHARIKDIQRRHGITYAYGEILESLRGLR